MFNPRGWTGCYRDRKEKIVATYPSGDEGYQTVDGWIVLTPYHLHLN
jgi:hypothetical protein